MDAVEEQSSKQSRRKLVIGPLPCDLDYEPDEEEKLAALRAAIDEGLASGVVEGDVFERVRQHLGLPSRS